MAGGSVGLDMISRRQKRIRRTGHDRERPNRRAAPTVQVQEIGTRRNLVDQDAQTGSHQVLDKAGNGTLTIGVAIRANANHPGAADGRPTEARPAGDPDNRPTLADELGEHCRGRHRRERTLHDEHPIGTAVQNLETLAAAIEAATGKRDARRARGPEDAIGTGVNRLDLHRAHDTVPESAIAVQNDADGAGRRDRTQVGVQATANRQPAQGRRKRSRRPGAPTDTQIARTGGALKRTSSAPNALDLRRRRKERLLNRGETERSGPDHGRRTHSFDMGPPVVDAQRGALATTDEHTVGKMVRRTEPSRVLPDVAHRARSMPFPTDALPTGSGLEHRLQGRPREAVHAASVARDVRIREIGAEVATNKEETSGAPKQGTRREERRMKSWQNRMRAAVLAGCIAAACGDSGPTGPSGPNDGTKPTTPTGTTPTGPGTGAEPENVAGVYHGTILIVQTLSSGGGETKRQSEDYCDAVVQEGETVSLIRFGITGRLQTNGDWNEIQNQEGRRSDSVLDSATWVRTTNETLEAEIIVIRSTLTFRYTPEMTRSEERCPNAEIVAGG